MDSELESPASGILKKILVEKGATVPVGTELAVIETEAEETEAKAPTQPEPVTEQREVAKPLVSEKEGAPAPVRSERSILLTGCAGDRQVRRNRGGGTGANSRHWLGRQGDEEGHSGLRRCPQGGRGRSAPEAKPEALPTPAAETTVTAAPEITPEPTASPSEDVEVVPMTRMRKLIAEHMVMSRRTAPHVTSVAEADVTRPVRFCEAVREEFQHGVGARLTCTSFFVEAADKGLREFPYMNASVDGDRSLLRKRINIGVAVAVDEGLIVPIIKNGDELNFIGVAKALHDLSSRARSKRLLPDDVQGGTFSITDIGTFGNLFGTSGFPQPRVGILTTGAIKKRPVVVDDTIAIRHMM